MNLSFSSSSSSQNEGKEGDLIFNEYIESKIIGGSNITSDIFLMQKQKI